LRAGGSSGRRGGLGRWQNRSHPLRVTPRMRRIRGVVVIAAALSLFAAAGCGGYGGGSKDSDEAEGTTTIAGMQTESHGTKDVSGETGKVEIELYDDYFEPTVLKGKPGQKVELELKNEGNNPHTLTISDQMVDQEVQP